MKTFKPSPDLAYNHTLFAYWENAFTKKEINDICKIGKNQKKLKGTINGNKIDIKMRSSTISWLDAEGWIADRLEFIALQLNGKYFGLDLWGFSEQLQFTTYKYNKDINEQEHYTWHMDCGPGLSSPRKLSLVLQLSDPDEYEGGELQIFTGGNEAIPLKKQKGIIHAFPSYVLHRVTPVTKGIRKTLVVWITGPRFK